MINSVNQKETTDAFYETRRNIIHSVFSLLSQNLQSNPEDKSVKAFSNYCSAIVNGTTGGALLLKILVDHSSIHVRVPRLFYMDIMAVINQLSIKAKPGY